MARPRLGQPFDVVLPSGAKATVRATQGERPASDLGQAIDLGGVESTLPFATMALCDANVLEAILAAIGAIAPEPVTLGCRNCGQEVELDGAAELPLEPLLDPPGDPELDAGPFDVARWHALPRPIDVGRRGAATRFRLARRTFADRRKLEQVLGPRDAPLPFGPPLVRALGLDALGDEKGAIVESPIAIARAIDAVDDARFGETWDALVRAYDAQHWPPRLLAAVPCPACGARHDVEPVRRPLDWAEEARGDAPDEPFPDLATFRRRAAEITRAVLDESGLDGVTGLEVIVDDDVPPCDDGGEPLLGSYTPDLAADGDVRVGQTSPFVVALYYRSFRAMYEEPYDVDAEIRETIEHELEHHAGFLRGHDPLDDEERLEIARERARRLGVEGDGRALVASASWLASDFGRFLKVTWPIWMLALLGLLLIVASGR